MKFVFTLVFALIVQVLYANTSVDSMKVLLKNEEIIHKKIEYLNSICKYYIDAELYDSVLIYAKYLKQYSRQADEADMYADACMFKAMSYLKTSRYDEAVYQTEISMFLYKQTRNIKGIVSVYKYNGVIYYNQSKFQLALQNYFIALRITEYLGDIEAFPSIYNQIGAVYRYSENYDLSLKYFYSALNMKIKLGETKGLANLYSNIAALYQLKGEYNTSLSYLQKALQRSDISKEELSASYNNMANTYLLMNEPHKSIEYSLKALLVQEEINDNIGKAISQTNIASAFLQNNKFSEAEEWALSGLRTAKRFGIKRIENKIYDILKTIKAKQQDFESAYNYLTLYHAQKDSVINLQTKRQIEELHVKYETEKKQTEIEKQKSRILEQELLLNKKNLLIIINIITTLLVLASIVIVFIKYRMNQQKRMSQLILEEQKSKTKTIIETVENERKRVARDLHDGIGQTMVAFKMKLHHFLEKIHTSPQDVDISSILNETIKNLDATYYEIRTISHEMMPKSLQELGLVNAIQDLLEKSFLNTSIAYTFENRSKERLDEIVEIGMYRILQELINNIIKHSKADKVVVSLFQTDKQIIFIVEDNGIGLKKRNGDDYGIGLKNIDARVNAINGRIEIVSDNSSQGTTFVIRIPV